MILSRQFRLSALFLSLAFVGQLACPVTTTAAERFVWTIDEKQGTADLILGDVPVVRYMFAHDFSTPERRDETYKVFHHVFGPGTKTLITKGAGGDYPHHRGIYLGFNRTKYEGKSSDFWHCKEEKSNKEGACLKHVGFRESQGDSDHGWMTSDIHWLDAAGQPVVVEARTLDVRKLPLESPQEFGWQIDVKSVLESRRGKVELDGDRQHAGLQFRAAQIVAKENSAHYVRPAGFPEQEKAFEVDDGKEPEKHVNLGWLAMSYPIGNERYTVQYCEDPSLPKPSRFSERPYGRFGAFFKAELDTDKPLTLRYRFLITPGNTPSREVLQKRYDEFVKSLKNPGATP